MLNEDRHGKAITHIFKTFVADTLTMPWARFMCQGTRSSVKFLLIFPQVNVP